MTRAGFDPSSYSSIMTLNYRLYVNSWRVNTYSWRCDPPALRHLHTCVCIHRYICSTVNRAKTLLLKRGLTCDLEDDLAAWMLFDKCRICMAARRCASFHESLNCKIWWNGDGRIWTGQKSIKARLAWQSKYATCRCIPSWDAFYASWPCPLSRIRPVCESWTWARRFLLFARLLCSVWKRNRDWIRTQDRIQSDQSLLGVNGDIDKSSIVACFPSIEGLKSRFNFLFFEWTRGQHQIQMFNLIQAD